MKVSLDDNVALWKNIAIHFRPAEIEFLYALANAPYEWLTTNQLMHVLYGAGEQAEDKILSVYASRIRRKFKEAQVPVTIEAGWFVGAGGKRWRMKYA